MSDINVNEIANTLQVKVDLPDGVGQDAVDFVVASQLPTAENNYTWYRLYKSGWVEQGGFISSGTTSGSVNLLKEMSDTMYQVMTTPYSEGTNFTTCITSYPSTTSSFSWNSYNNSATTKIWQVKGMSAQGGNQ